jgi:hypothetical protein
MMMNYISAWNFVRISTFLFALGTEHERDVISCDPDEIFITR